MEWVDDFFFFLNLQGRDMVYGLIWMDDGQLPRYQCLL